jgi:hypothetical protein
VTRRRRTARARFRSGLRNLLDGNLNPHPVWGDGADQSHIDSSVRVLLSHPDDGRPGVKRFDLLSERIALLGPMNLDLFGLISSPTLSPILNLILSLIRGLSTPYYNRLFKLFLNLFFELYFDLF